MAADFDFAAMGKYAREHKDDDLSHLEENYVVGGAGKVYDLILPIAVLIVLCIGAMLYTGGILEGAGIIDAFADCSSSTALVLGSFFTLVFTFLLYIPRKVLTFAQFCEAFTEGFKSMVPAILILTLAWTLSGVCSADYLNIGGFVSSIVSADSLISMLMPAIFFLIALGLAFATGTSWGTFGILIPIAVAVFGDSATTMLVMTVAACLSGAVCGDHISPISDTTILVINSIYSNIKYCFFASKICCLIIHLGIQQLLLLYLPDVHRSAALQNYQYMYRNRLPDLFLYHLCFHHQMQLRQSFLHNQY